MRVSLATQNLTHLHKISMKYYQFDAVYIN